MKNKELVSLILEHRDQYCLKVHRGGWTKEHFPAAHDLRVEICLGGRSFIGRGVDVDAEVSFLKGFSEAVEHAHCLYYNWPSSIGVSCHKNIFSAREHAQEEYIERTLFNQFLDETTVGVLLSNDFLTRKWSFFDNLLNSTQKLEFTDQFIYIHNSFIDSDKKCILCVQKTNSGRIFYGLAFKETTAEALTHSYLEALTNTVAESTTTCSIEQNIDFELLNSLNIVEEVHPDTKTHTDLPLNIKNHKIAFPELSELPLVLCRAIEKDTISNLPERAVGQ